MIGALIGAAAGPVISGLFGQSSANKQMRFQERSQRSRYQWTMEDMKKAGLNPMLAYQQGGGSSLSGARATMPAPDFTGATTAKSLRRVQSAQEKLLSTQQIKEMENAALAGHQEEVASLEARIARGAHHVLSANPELETAIAYTKAMEKIGGPAQMLVGSAKALKALSSTFKTVGGRTITGKGAVQTARALTTSKTPRPPKLVE